MSNISASFTSRVKPSTPEASSVLSGFLLDLALVSIIAVVFIIGAVFIIGDGPVVTGSLMMLAGLVGGCIIGPAFYAGLKRSGSYEALVMPHREPRDAAVKTVQAEKHPTLLADRPAPFPQHFTPISEHRAPVAARRRQSGMRLLSSRPASARHLEKRTQAKKTPAA